VSFRLYRKLPDCSSDAAFVDPATPGTTFAALPLNATAIIFALRGHFLDRDV
jgi:hypothetical protein